MEPDVLRNIGLAVVRLGDAIPLVEPDAEVDEPAGQRAEGAVGVVVPRRPRAACRTRHAALGRHRRMVLGGDKACQLKYFRVDTPRRVT